MSHVHAEGGKPCKFRTIKECDEAYVEWQAVGQVRLAQHVVDEGRVGQFRDDDTAFGQLVRVMAGKADDITNAKGDSGSAPFTRRLVRLALGMRKPGASTTPG